ncbi:DNA-directed RNA polymerase II subunit RPB1-like isoform X2 [Dipodomys merriami]|uniref:DNA-directed RNA polymerase II subunit RPB1-like isoform X2 n=1 Tax=Dipodomys merriami TaxID=94247 RepID=UPI0038557D0E
MSQEAPSDPQRPQPAPPSTTQAETPGFPPSTYNPQSQQVSAQEPLQSILSRRVSSQEHSSAHSHRRVSIQEPLPSILSRPVSLQDSPSALGRRRVSIQEPSPPSSYYKFSFQDSPPAPSRRRVSIQEPSPASSYHRFSLQDSPLAPSRRRVSIQEPPVSFLPSQPNIQDTSPIFHSHQASIQDTPPVTYNRWVSARDPPSVLQDHQSTYPLNNVQFKSSSGPASTQAPPSQVPPKNKKVNLAGKQTWPQDNIPSTISQSGTIQSMESLAWDSDATSKEDHSYQRDPVAPNSTTQYLARRSTGIAYSGYRGKYSRQSLLPIGWRLLHEARKISRQLSLVLTLAGMLIIGIISLGQPWVHFQVPLMPPGGPSRPPTIAIDTILFVRCPDISCMHEYDQNAYLLDLAWAFLVISSITCFCLFVGLISTIFFTSSNLPMLDFFLFICSIMSGTSIVLAVLFYLLQANKYMQEGMTYTLGISFYLAWTGIFLFFITGFFSYLNYINFWSILAIQAIWT